MAYKNKTVNCTIGGRPAEIHSRLHIVHRPLYGLARYSYMSLKDSI